MCKIMGCDNSACNISWRFETNRTNFCRCFFLGGVKHTSTSVTDLMDNILKYTVHRSFRFSYSINGNKNVERRRNLRVTVSTCNLGAEG
jgi:hypothetical protein